MTLLAAFDCDGTLIRGDATRSFLLLLRGPVGLGCDLISLAPQLLAWRLGRLSTAALKQALIDRALQVTPVARRRVVLQHQLPASLRQQLRPQAMARLRWHQQQGHRCLIITASPEPLVQSLASHLALEWIATGCTDPLLVSPGRPFQLTTPNCKGPEKITRLRQYLGRLPDPDQLEAYGDSGGDRELLQASGSPHYRSFWSEARPYRPTNAWRWLVPLLAALLFLIGLKGIGTLSAADQQALRQATGRIMQWLPALYGLLAISYLGRYLRWRILLHAADMGRCCWADALGWFRGFALTATPGKLGELSRVQHLHTQLGYPRLPLLHAFLAERLCDAAAVLVWLAILAPQASRGLARGALWAGVIGSIGLAGLWLFRTRWHAIWQQWRHHLPHGAMARACGPAAVVSVLFWACEGLILWVLVAVLAPASVSPATAIAIYLLSGTAGVVSSVPGGVGVNEAATTLLLQQQGVPLGIALPIAILRRVFTIWSIAFLSMIILASRSHDRQIS
ncbi:HAD-IB family phosphatase [Synechococcus sp. CBW1107]|uniref:HAD-IB family phosphatase n=1 Tax=Synechococcus sp. CBW1107 TaxID=2789857 RepID=UPI002AD57FE6|nr:HAD-IB family phosphatase [Synechococcus sp. CBW1107]CAK6696920.1 hypothetical protein IFHNHDMJ_02123 [Synechococcus sp. CBW1107]